MEKFLTGKEMKRKTEEASDARRASDCNWHKKTRKYVEAYIALGGGEYILYSAK